MPVSTVAPAAEPELDLTYLTGVVEVEGHSRDAVAVAIMLIEAAGCELADVPVGRTYLARLRIVEVA